MGWGVMTAERVDFFALAIGCAIAGCWSMVWQDPARAVSSGLLSADP